MSDDPRDEILAADEKFIRSMIPKGENYWNPVTGRSNFNGHHWCHDDSRSETKCACGATQRKVKIERYLRRRAKKLAAATKGNPHA